MKRISACSLFLAAILLLGFCNDVRAASLYGKVIDVNDGDVVTLSNLNRSVRVKLMGVDAPEAGQPFGDVAKQHLRYLVLDKFVTVEYSSLGADGSIVGKVTVEGADVCAQMIRDGAAWFDINHNSRLSETDRQIYSQSEAAARSEKRGLWQSEKAIAPWEFTRLQTIGALESRGLETRDQPSVPKRTAPSTPQLTPEAVLGPDFVRAGDKSDFSWAAPIDREWRQFEPPGQNFSVIVPADGRKSVDVTLFQDKPINTYAYMVRDRTTMYSVIWLAGPDSGEPDEFAITIAMTGILKAFGQSYQRLGESFRCEAKSPRKVAVKDYTAREFDLVGCHRPGIFRVYTRVARGERKFIMGLSFFEESDLNVRRFLNSFKLKAD